MRYSLLIVTLALLASSCKKNDPPASGGSGGGSGNGTTITASNATTFNAILAVYDIYTVSGGTSWPVFKYSSAYFTSNATQYPNSSTFVNVNNVSLNGVKYKFQTYNYADTTYSLTYPPATWQVSGMGSIPSFTYTNTDPMPTFTGTASLPDTVNITQSLTVSASTAAGFNEMTISVSDANSHTAAAMLASGASSATISSASMSTLVATNSGHLVVSLTKNNVRSVNGVPMNFTTTYQYNKSVTIK